MRDYFSFVLLAAYGLGVFLVGYLWDAKRYRRGASDSAAKPQAGGALWKLGPTDAVYDQGYKEGKQGTTKTGFFGEPLEKSERPEKK
jgi:hypothetical protein